ncbi:hypothetical protein Avbf_16481, partial [Armadillidium vulgare]
NLYINMLIIDMNKVHISISLIISNKTKGFKVPVVGACLSQYTAISVVGAYSHLSEFLFSVYHKYEAEICSCREVIETSIWFLTDSRFTGLHQS